MRLRRKFYCMTTKVSHIVINGCSFTYCQGIEEPSKNGWPALLSKKLGIPVVNLAIGGSGNDSIHRRTYEYFYKNKKQYPNSKPLFITAFSGSTRREEFFKTYKGDRVDSFMTLDLEATSIDLVATLSEGVDSDRLVEYSHIMNMSFEACERKKFLCWNSLVNLFKAHRVPYLTGDYFPTVDEHVINYMNEKFPEFQSNALDDINYVGEITDYTDHVEKLACGHEPAEAMPIVADLFYNKLVENYDIEFEPAEYLTLKSFYHFNQSFRLPGDWVE